LRVAIIGGGIAGLSVAYQLNRHGVTIDLYERNGDIAEECSFANGGQISACNFQTLHTFTNLKKGLSWLFKKGAPLYITPSLDVDKIKWILKFLGTTIQGKGFENSIKTLDLAMLSRREYSKYFSEFSKAEVGHSAAYKGMLQLFDTEKDMDAATTMISMIEEYNSDKAVSNRMKFTRAWPGEIDLPFFNTKIYGGYLFKEDGIADLNLLCKQMLASLKESLTFVLHTNSDVTSIEKIPRYGNKSILTVNELHSGGVYDAIVIATGWQGDLLSRKFGTTLNLYPVKGYSISIECDIDDVPPDYSILHDSKKIVSSTFRYPDGRTLFRVAGTMEIGSFDEPELNYDRIEPLVEWAFDNFDINCLGYDSFACARPMTPGMMPMYGPTKNDPTIFIHNGLGHLGLTLAMGTAKLLTEKILNV